MDFMHCQGENKKPKIYTGILQVQKMVTQNAGEYSNQEPFRTVENIRTDFIKKCFYQSG